MSLIRIFVSISKYNRKRTLSTELFALLKVGIFLSIRCNFVLSTGVRIRLAYPLQISNSPQQCPEHYTKLHLIAFVWFGGISKLVGYLKPNPLYTFISNIYDLVSFGLVWLGFIAYHQCRLFNAKSSLYISIKYIGFGLVWFGLVSWYNDHCRLFNAKSSLYIDIKYIGFGLVGFHGISTIVGYLMPNPLYIYIYIYIYQIYRIWFGWVLLHINHHRLFKAKFY